MIDGEIISNILGEWSNELNIYSMTLRVCLSVIFAFCLGSERSIKGHSAGIKTFILMAMATTISAFIDLFLMENYEMKIPLCLSISILGSAIIGGNVILFNSRNQIKGITTSSWLWTSSIMGAVAGLGLYTLSIILLILFVIISIFMPKIELYLKKRSTHFEIHIELKDKKDLPNLISVIRQLGMRVDEIEFDTAFVNSGISAYSIKIIIVDKDLRKNKQHNEIIDAIKSLGFVFYVEERN